MRQDVRSRVQSLLHQGAEVEGSAAAKDLEEVTSAYIDVR
jgi:hypothetical protein